MFGKKAAEAGWEARALETSPRGVPYVYFGREFMPGIWQPVTADEARQLRISALELREVKDGA